MQLRVSQISYSPLTCASGWCRCDLWAWGRRRDAGPDGLSVSVCVDFFLSANSADGNASHSATQMPNIYDVNKLQTARWTGTRVCPGTVSPVSPTLLKAGWGGPWGRRWGVLRTVLQETSLGREWTTKADVSKTKCKLVLRKLLSQNEKELVSWALYFSLPNFTSACCRVYLLKISNFTLTFPKYFLLEEKLLILNNFILKKSGKQKQRMPISFPQIPQC